MLPFRIPISALLVGGALAVWGGAPAGAQPVPAKPTPVKFTAPKITRNMSAEQQKYYDEHPDEMRKAVEEEKRLKRAVSEHEAATRQYRAQVQRSKTEARRREVVARVRDRAPKFDPVSARKAPASDGGMSTATKVVLGLLVPVLVLVLVRRRVLSP